MRRTLLALALTLSTRPLHAQPDVEEDGPEARAALPTRLDDLIDVAVRLSPDLVRARLDRTAASDSARAERRAQAWVVTSQIKYSRSGIADSVQAPPLSVVATEEATGSIAIGRNLPTGGAISFEVGGQRTQQEYEVVAGAGAQAAGAATGPEYSELARTSLSVSLKQPVVRGFGPTITLAPQRKAELAQAVATVQAQLAAEQLVRDLVVGYWELAYASFEVETLAGAIDLARKQGQLVREQIRAGAQPSAAMDDVTYTIAVRDEELLRARLGLEKQSLGLRRKAGLEIDRRDIVIKPGDPFELTEDEDELDVDAELARSRVANRKLATVQLEKKLADVDVALATDQTRPQLDVTLSGALIGQGQDVGAAAATMPSAFEVTAGLSLSFELSGAARKARDAAAAKRRRLDTDRMDLERQLEVEVVTAVKAVAAARTRVSLADKAIEVAETGLRAERASFVANRTTSFQLMQRQGALVDARLRRGRAIADFHQAVAQLQFLSGELLGRYGVGVRAR